MPIVTEALIEAFRYAQLLQRYADIWPTRILPVSAATQSNLVFTALHAMQTRSSDEKAVCLSVRLSVRLSNAWIVTKRKKDLSRFLYHTKNHFA